MLTRTVVLVAAMFLFGPLGTQAEVSNLRIVEKNLPSPDLRARVPEKALKRGAVLALVPEFGEGDTFTVDVVLDPRGVAVNAVAAAITYPSESLLLTGLDHTDGKFSIYLEEDASRPGRVDISALQPYPGILERSLVLRLSFRFIAESPALITSDAGSVTLANDGYGTDVLRFRTGVLISPAGR